MKCFQSTSGHVALHGWLAVTVLILVVWTSFFLLHEPVQRRLDIWDSAAYIDCARSIARGEGFLQRPLYSLDRPGTRHPIQLWPPGYPLLIAGFVKLGFSPYQAAVAVSGVSAGIAALLIACLATRMFSLPLGLALTFMVISMPAFARKGCMCSSEAPYTVAVLLSLLCLMRATRQSCISPGWAFLAGVLAGQAWCIRNVGAGFLAACACYLAAFLLSKHRRANVRAGIVWGLGCLLSAGWLLYWNIATFGSWSGYTMDPSDRPFLLNLGDALDALAIQLTGVQAVAQILTTTPATLVLGTVLVLSVAVWLKGKSPARLRSFAGEQRHMFLLGAVAFFHILTLVVARTVYRWGAIVDEGYLSSICWVVPFLLLAVGTSFCTRLPLRPGTVVILLVLVLGAGASLQIRRQYRLRSWYRTHYQEWICASDLADLRREIPADKFVLCDHAGVLMTRTGLDARYPAKVDSDRTSDGELLTSEDLRRVGECGWLGGVLATDTQTFRDGRYGQFLKDLVTEPNRFPEFCAKRLSSGALLLTYVGAPGEKESQAHLTPGLLDH